MIAETVSTPMRSAHSSGPCGIVRAELHGSVDVCGGRYPLHQSLRGLINDESDDPRPDEAWRIAHDHRLPFPAPGRGLP